MDNRIFKDEDFKPYKVEDLVGRTLEVRHSIDYDEQWETIYAVDLNDGVIFILASDMIQQ